MTGSEREKERAAPLSPWKRARARIIALALVALSATGLYFHFARETEIQGKPLSRWIDELQSADPEKRAQAARIIKHYGQDHLGLLTNSLGSSRLHTTLRDYGRRLPEVIRSPLRKVWAFTRTPISRYEAARALEIIGEPASNAIPALISALDDPDVGASSQAASALARIGKPAAPALAQALSSTNGAARSHACRALGAIGPDAASAVPAIIQLMLTDPGLRAYDAAHTLGQIGPASIPFVRPLLTNDDPHARQFGAMSLAYQTELPDDVKAALKTLREDPKEDVQRAANQALIKAEGK